MKSISQYIAKNLGEAGVIQNDDVSHCSYGLEVFFLTILEFLSVIIIAVFVGNAIETLCFFLSFLPLRIYAGGYHANSRLRCYFILLAVYALFSSLIWILQTNIFAMAVLVIMIISLVAIVGFAPVTAKKSVIELELIYYKKVSIIIALVEMLISVLGIFLLPDNIYMFSFGLGQLAAALSLIAAVIKNHAKQKKYHVMKGGTSMKNIFKKGFVKYGHVIAAVAFCFVAFAANSPCIIPYYEPEEPVGIEKYKKFNK